MTEASPSVRRALAGCLRGACCGALLAAAPAASAAQAGVLVLAHGGSEHWNTVVEQTVEQADLAFPTRIAFGMGMTAQEVTELQQAVDDLQQAGVDQIVAVPLFVSSTSEVMDQLRYLLGLRAHGPWEAAVHPVALRVPVVMTDALDDDPVVADILLDRIRELSHAPEAEEVVVVAHGPANAEDDARWLDVMTRIAARIRQEGGFHAVLPVTMQDDAPPPVREAAIQKMRGIVQQSSREHRTLVVPLLIASGGIEAKIPQALEGLEFAYSGAALLPHPKLAAWIARQVRTALGVMARLPQWRVLDTCDKMSNIS